MPKEEKTKDQSEGQYRRLGHVRLISRMSKNREAGECGSGEY